MARLTDYIIKMTEEVTSMKGALSSLSDKVSGLDKRLRKIETSLEALPWRDVGKKLEELSQEVDINTGAIKILESKDAQNARIKRTFSEWLLSPAKDTGKNVIKAILLLVAGMALSRLLVYFGLVAEIDRAIKFLN